jgi:hypothetical protein
VAGGNYGNYNTTGVLKGPSGASAAKAEEASPEIVVTAGEISKLDALQMLLDVIGLVPGFGAPADILNAIISGARGDWLGAALSLFGAVPVAGEAATAAKIAKNSEKYAAAVAKVADEVLPYLPAKVQDALRPAIEAAKKKIDELGGKKPKPEPDPPPKAKDEGADGATVKPKPKPKCGQSGPYKDRKGHDNDGMNWDHVPSQKALLERAEALNGGELSARQIAAIVENAPTIAIPKGLHRDHSETFAGRQHQKVDGVKRPVRDSQDLQRATRENTDAILKNIDKADPGCKAAYTKAAADLAKRTDADWAAWLTKTIKEAD